MAFYSQGKEFLNLPEQVEKNKTDIADLKTKEADTATDVATNTTEIAGLKNRTSTLESRTNSVNGSILTGSIQAEKDSEFGSNLIIDGGLTLNSPSDLHFKSGDTDYTDFNDFKNNFFRYYGQHLFNNRIFSEYVDFSVETPFDSYFTDITGIFAYMQVINPNTGEIDPSTGLSLPDYPNVIEAGGMLKSCSVGIITLGNIYATLTSAFEKCPNLTEIRVADGKSAKARNRAGLCFLGSSKLISIGEIDMSDSFNNGNMFDLCTSLKHIHCKHWTHSFNISDSTQFEQSDLVEIIGNLDSVASPQTLTMGATNLAKLTQDQILVATGKGWTLA